MTVKSRRADRTGRQSRWIRVLLLSAVAGGLICGGWKLFEIRRYRRSMAEIKREIQAGRHGHAVRKLVVLSTWKPDSDEAAYLLGVCETARGRAAAAFQAWERVSPGSAFGARAIRGRMELLVERGRLSDAERLIIQAASDPRIDGSGLRLFLGPVYSLQGRVEEGERLIETCWEHLNATDEGSSEMAILLVRLHIRLWREIPPVQEVRSFLDQVTQSAPDDDRGWLGRANLATRAGMYGDAEHWLDACLRRRPDDVAVWRARLDWALATHRLADVRQAMGHLPVADSTPAQVERLTAWLAAIAGDLASERQALERLIAVNPADFNTLDRLVAIARKEGKEDRADELRRKKFEVERVLVRYEKLYKRNQTIRDATEMASLAEQLGQPFEAKVLLTIAVAMEPEHRRLRDELLRSGQDNSTPQSSAGNLADLLAKDLDVADRATSR
jgi:thioredoxin-like negative regulator of GroEL